MTDLEHETIANNYARSCDLRCPSALFIGALKFSVDGDQWCCLLGENLQDGVAGFGDSPAKAATDFDRAWTASLSKKGV